MRIELSRGAIHGHPTDRLMEDMLQVAFAGGLLLDVGGYPAFDVAGGLRISVIKHYDGARPVIALTARAMDELIEKLALAQNAVKGELRNTSLGTCG